MGWEEFGEKRRSLTYCPRRPAACADGKGKASPDGRPTIHPGAIVQCRYDPSAGTLSYAVDGAEVGVCFTGLRGKKLFPAVGFYSSDRAVTLVRAGEGDPPVARSGTAPVASAPAPSTLAVLPSTVFQYFDGGIKGPRFSTTLSSSFSFSADNRTVRSTARENRMAIVDRTFGPTRAVWEFRIDKDEPENQCVTVGAIIAGATSRAYDVDTSLQLRGYSGGVYGRGKTGVTGRKFSVGDVVRVQWDGLAGTITMYVNSMPCGITHRGLIGVTVQPAIVTYSNDRAVSLLRCVEVQSFPPETAHEVWYRPSSGPSFDMGASSGTSNMEYTPAMRMARSTGGSNSMAVFDCRLRSCCAVVEFRLDKDENA